MRGRSSEHFYRCQCIVGGGGVVRLKSIVFVRVVRDREQRTQQTGRRINNSVTGLNLAPLQPAKLFGKSKRGNVFTFPLSMRTKWVGSIDSAVDV